MLEFWPGVEYYILSKVLAFLRWFAAHFVYNFPLFSRCARALLRCVFHAVPKEKKQNTEEADSKKQDEPEKKKKKSDKETEKEQKWKKYF